MNISAVEETERLADDDLTIAGERFQSRLFLGTAKYPSDSVMRRALAAAGCQLVTVAIRRLRLGDSSAGSVLEGIDRQRYRIVPNTSGCETADEAVRIARLAREMGVSDWVKLEVIPDGFQLLPDPEETLKAARTLVREGFTVLPYINADPVLAQKLEDIGCAAVMPLGSPIGSGQGLVTQRQIELIIKKAKVPVVVDAGIGAPSDAALAMEIGASAVLVQTAVAQAGDPVLMATAMRQGVEAGRGSFLSGRIPRGDARPSSPEVGISRPR